MTIHKTEQSTANTKEVWTIRTAGVQRRENLCGLRHHGGEAYIVLGSA